MISVEIKINDEALQKALDSLRAKLRNMRPFYKVVGEVMVPATQARFPKMVSPEGRPWQKLAPATVAAKKRNPDRILRGYTGHLQDRIFYQADSSRLLVGSPMIYSAIHQFGGPVRKRQSVHQKPARSGREHLARRVSARPFTMPARPYLGVSRSDAERILEKARDFLAL